MYTMSRLYFNFLQNESLISGPAASDCLFAIRSHRAEAQVRVILNPRRKKNGQVGKKEVLEAKEAKDGKHPPVHLPNPNGPSREAGAMLDDCGSFRQEREEGLAILLGLASNEPTCTNADNYTILRMIDTAT